MPRVSQAAINVQLQAIEALIAEHPAGIGRAALAAAYAKRYGEKLQPRTLQRRLEQLGDLRRIVYDGESTSRIYRPGPAIGVRMGAPAAVPPPDATTIITAPASVVREKGGEGSLPLSPEGAEIRALVRRPIVARGPVGYRRDFLEGYEPGVTWYLPRAMRERLHELGRTPDEDRPAGTYAREILGRLLIDLAWASSRLEGNTYSRLDTQNLIEFGQHAEGKDAAEAQMILNHKSAIELLVTEADSLGFDRRTLLTLHAALSENLIADPGDEGRLRTRLVQITGTRYVPPGVPQVIEDCSDRLLQKAAAIPDPFEQAFFVMVHVPYLQPFADVNKRTSRLAANISFIRENLCPLSFVDVPERAYIDGVLGVYELTRIELLRDVFAWAYERSCAQYRVVREAMGQPDPLRLRYRAQLAEVVRETVLAGAPPRTESLRAWAVEHGVPPHDLEGFAERALALLVNLHEGTAGRYRLRPGELLAWRARFTPERPRR